MNKWFSPQWLLKETTKAMVALIVTAIFGLVATLMPKFWTILWENILWLLALMKLCWLWLTSTSPIPHWIIIVAVTLFFFLAWTIYKSRTLLAPYQFEDIQESPMPPLKVEYEGVTWEEGLSTPCRGICGTCDVEMDATILNEEAPAKTDHPVPMRSFRERMRKAKEARFECALCNNTITVCPKIIIKRLEQKHRAALRKEGKI